MAVTGCPAHIGRIFKGGTGLYRTVDDQAGMFYGEHSMLSMDGEAHVRLRKLLLAPVLRNPYSAAPLMRDAAMRAFDGQVLGERFDILGKARSITLDVILQVVFGVLEEADRQAFVKAIHGLQGSVGFFAVFVKGLRRDLGPWSPWGRFIRARARCYALIDARIAAVRSIVGSDGTSVLEQWVASRDLLGQAALSDAEIRDNLLTMLFAGHDSTAVALSWCMYWTHREPGVLVALLDELQPYARTLDVDLLEHAPCLDAVCREALRIHPIAPGVARRLSRAMELGGFTVPEGDVVMACTDLASHDPALYPEPQRFRFERFLERDFEHNEFLPFGGGERRCLAAALAFAEMRVVLATLIVAYRFRLAENRIVEPVWTHGIRGPKAGIGFILEARNPESGYPPTLLS